MVEISLDYEAPNWKEKALQCLRAGATLRAVPEEEVPTIRAAAEEAGLEVRTVRSEGVWLVLPPTADPSGHRPEPEPAAERPRTERAPPEREPSAPAGSGGPPLADPDRLEAIARTGLLDLPEGSERLDRLTRLARKLAEAPTSLVTLVTTERQVLPGCTGLPEPYQSRRETPIDHSFCRHAIERDDRLVIEDSREHPLVQDSPAIEELGAVSYAGIPVRTGEGHVLGTLCALDDSARPWSDEQLQSLEDLAGAAQAEIRFRLERRARREVEERLEECRERLTERGD